jgi:hypothetical protein
MSWGPDLHEEIVELFAPLNRCISRAWLIGVLIDHDSRLAAMQERERVDPEWRKHVADGREKRRRERIAADPEYAARVRQQRRDAKRRWAERVGPAGLREKWRKQKAAYEAKRRAEVQP